MPTCLRRADDPFVELLPHVICRYARDNNLVEFWLCTRCDYLSRLVNVAAFIHHVIVLADSVPTSVLGKLVLV